jgi:hypothetical protein
VKSLPQTEKEENMYRMATLLTAATATAVLTAVPAWAQSPAGHPQGHRLQQRDSGQSQPAGLKEDFDQDPVVGWDFRGQHAFVPAGNGRALATKSGAFWDAAGEVADFTMKVRYGYERGIALVDFRHARRYGINDRYVLLLSPTGVSLIRVQHLPGDVQEKELASAPCSLPPQTWHDVIIQAAGGQINVWVNGKGVISVRDAQPLRSGLCALGVESGVVLYDHIILIPQGQPEQDGLASDPSKWGSSSAARQSGRTGSSAAPAEVKNSK